MQVRQFKQMRPNKPAERGPEADAALLFRTGGRFKILRAQSKWRDKT
jgi:hypothetical protein